MGNKDKKTQALSTPEVQTLKFSIVDSNRMPLPEYSESVVNGRMVQWGADNQFPNILDDMYRQSPTLGSVIDGTVRFICGNGLSIADDAAKWRDTVNRRNETLDDIVEAVALDLVKFNGFAVQVIYNKLGEMKELYALDFARCRVDAAYKKVFYSKKKWGSYTTKYEEYDMFDPEKVDPEHPTQIFWIKFGSRTVYPIPCYQSAFRDILSEIASSKYVLNNMSNQLTPKVVITIPNTSGLLTDDEKNAVKKEIKQRFCGPDADSSFFLYFKTEEGEDMKIDPIKTEDESDKFEKIKNSARESIFISFRATPNLFGLPTATTGFNEQEYNQAFKLYQKTQIQGYQKKIERALNRIIAAKDGITILPFSLEDKSEEE